jgi:hypothetical protein
VTVDLRGTVDAGYAGPESPADDGVEICTPARLVSFFASARRELSSTFGWPGDPDGSMTESYRWSWELRGNRGARLGDEAELSSVRCVAWPAQLPCVVTDPPPPPPPDFNGARTVLVDTFVGARLELSALLSVLAGASHIPADTAGAWIAKAEQAAETAGCA